MDLQQHVSGCTHRKCHTLDLVLNRKDDSLLLDGVVSTDEITLLTPP